MENDLRLYPIEEGLEDDIIDYINGKELDENELVSPLKPIVRIATEEDTEIYFYQKYTHNLLKTYLSYVPLSFVGITQKFLLLFLYSQNILVYLHM